MTQSASIGCSLGTVVSVGVLGVAAVLGLPFVSEYEVETEMQAFVEGMPKAELHVHIEGCLEPPLMIEIAERNGMLESVLASGDWSSKDEAIEEITKRRKNYDDLHSFLMLYNAASGVLRKREDFYDLMASYIHHAKLSNIRYAEIFFDPQSHLERGVPIDDIVEGLYGAILDHEKVPPHDKHFKGKLIASVLRDWKLTEDDERMPLGDFSGLPSAMRTLDLLEPYKDKILGLGMSNSEVSTRPRVFKSVFKRAASMGLRLVSHSGEEGMPVPYITEALELGIERIDHGVMSLHDEDVLRHIVDKGIPLTTCPLSNDMLKVTARFFDGETNQLRRLLDKGAKVTVNSDDPAFFKGYLNCNYHYVVRNSNLTKSEVLQVAANAFKASFMSKEEIASYLEELYTYAKHQGVH